MHIKRAADKRKTVEEKVKSINEKHRSEELSVSLDQNMDILKALFSDVDILRMKFIQNTQRKELRFGIAFSDGLVNSSFINDNILRPLMISDVITPSPMILDVLQNQVIQIAEAEQTTDYIKIIEAVCYGDTILFAEGIAKALILNTKGYLTRATAEPDSEKILSGPREGFTESLMNNLSFVRRRMRTSELKMKMLTLGRRSKTSVCVCYMNGLARKEIVDEVLRRLGQIDIDAILDSNYITELIRDKRWALFRTLGYTERPDVVVSKLLEGRVAIIVDGTPVAITAPYLFIENFQSGEDYYLSFYYTSFSRILRMVGFFLTVGVPGFYIAVVAFHHEMLPTPLLINIAAEQSSVPLPAAIEAFVMLVVFDILRETGIRMPSNVGQALSIVGALVIGQAAVEAKLVASPMIIVIGITGITNLLVPKLNAPAIYMRLFVLLISSIFGFFGFVLSMSCLLIHIFNLTSFGVPEVSLGGSFQYQGLKDQPIRAPWWQMLNRPEQTAQEAVRMKIKDRNGNA